MYTARIDDVGSLENNITRFNIYFPLGNSSVTMIWIRWKIQVLDFHEITVSAAFLTIGTWEYKYRFLYLLQYNTANVKPWTYPLPNENLL